jgi:hypothetical protein
VLMLFGSGGHDATVATRDTYHVSCKRALCLVSVGVCDVCVCVCVCVCDALLHKWGGGGEEEGTESVGTRQCSLCCARLMPRMPET